MLIEAFSTLFDTAELTSKQRVVAARVLVRMLAKISTYSQECVELKRVLGDSGASSVHEFWHSNRRNYNMHVLYWRGIHAMAHGRDCDQATEYSGNEVPVRDLIYCMHQLRQSDLVLIRKSGLRYRRKPLSEAGIVRVTEAVSGYVRHYARKMFFISEYSDKAMMKEDIESNLQLKALELTLRYEHSRRDAHLINTVKRGLGAEFSEMCSYYKRDCRDQMPSREATDEGGRKVFEYESRIAPLTITDTDGSESENPELMSRCVDPTHEIETQNFVAHVCQVMPRYGRYLKIVTCPDQKPTKFLKWARENRADVENPLRFIQNAKRYAGITKRDEVRARNLYLKRFACTRTLVL